MLTDRELLLSPAPTLSSSSQYRVGRLLQQAAFWCIILNIGVGAIIAGLVLRKYAWDQTESIRFVADINNAFRQGTETLREGYLARYTNQTDMGGAEYDFDYAPGRLLVATYWTKWVRTKVDGPVTDWQFVSPWQESFYQEARSLGREYELCRPLMIVNIVGEIAATIAMFLLVRQWTSGSSRPRVFFWPQDRPMRSAILGLISALFFWFNPALISNAHTWPQWDSWVLPFYLWALVMASADYWLCAGLFVAAGVMFKAQILFGAPLLILWPLWRGQLLAIVRFLIGVASATAVITAVWLLRADDAVNKQAVFWVVCVGLSLPVLWMAVRAHWPAFIRAPLAAVSIILVTWPMFHSGWMWVAGSVLALAGLGVLFHFQSMKVAGYALAGWIAAAMFACVPIFHGSVAWFSIGIAFGTHRYPMMTRGTDNNLAAILESEWHWNLMDPTLTIPAGNAANWIGSTLTGADPHFLYVPNQPLDLPLKYLLFSIFVTAVILCSLGAAIQSRRGSPRFLIAITAPWIVFFAVLPQMHQRYLLWGATLSAATVALGPGFMLLHLVITCIAWSQEAADMMVHNPDRNPQLYSLIHGWSPGMGWAVMLIAAIFVYLSVTPGRRIARRFANSSPRRVLPLQRVEQPEQTAALNGRDMIAAP